MCAHYVILIPPCVPNLSNIYSPITIFSLFCGNFWVTSLGFDPEAKTLEGQKLDRTSRKYKLLSPPIPHLKKCLKNCFFKDHKFRQYLSQNVFAENIQTPTMEEISIVTPPPPLQIFHFHKIRLTPSLSEFTKRNIFQPQYLWKLFFSH